MSNLKKFYEAAEKDEKIKQTLLEANEKAKGMNEEEIKQEIIRLAAQFGYEISEEDFKAPEGELGDDALTDVAGGVSASCFFSNAGCTALGEIDPRGGCIILGLY